MKNLSKCELVASEASLEAAMGNDNLVLFKSLMATGVSSFAAGQAVQSEIMRRHNDSRFGVMGELALSVIAHSINKNRSNVMKCLHSSVATLDAIADETNAELSIMAAGLTDVSGKFVWTAPVVSSWSQSLVVGDKTLLDQTKGGQVAKQYEGFSGTDLLNFLMSRTKANWASAATSALMEPIYQVLLDGAARGLLKDKPTFTNWGSPSWKWVFRNVGYLRFMAALWERETEGGQFAYKTNKVERLTLQVRVAEMATQAGNASRFGDGESVDAYGASTTRDSGVNGLTVEGAGGSPIIGDHYAQVRQDELAEAELALEHLEDQADVYEQLLPHLEVFNAVNEWADVDFIVELELPDLSIVTDAQTKGAEERMLNAIALAAKFLAKTQEEARKKRVAFEATLAKGDEALLADI